MAEAFEGLSEEMQKEINKIFADKIAEAATAMISDETIAEYAKQLFFSLKWDDNKTRYWSSDTKSFQAMVFIKFTEKVSSKLQKIVDDGLFDEEAQETAERIYKESMEAAEKYMVEALARNMCAVSSDFNNTRNKMDMTLFVNQVMQKHISDDHRRY